MCAERKLAAFFGALMAAGIFAACTYQVGSVELFLVFSPDSDHNPLDPNLVRSLRLTASGPGMETYRVEIKPAARGGTLADLPVGEDRQILVEGLGSLGEVLASGLSRPFEAGGDNRLYVYFSLTGKFSGPPAGRSGIDTQWARYYRTAFLEKRFFHAQALFQPGELFISGGALAPSDEDFSGLIQAPGPRTLEVLDAFAGALRADLPSVDCDRGVLCLQQARARHEMTPLSDGAHALVVGGEPPSNEWPVELFERERLGFLRTSAPVHPRLRPAVARLGEQVVLAGGMEADSRRLSDEVSVYRSGFFTDYSGLLSEARSGAQAVALEEQRLVLVIGGWKALGAVDDWRASDAVDLLDFSGAQPKSESFRLLAPRADHSAVLMPDGMVLVCGGRAAARQIQPGCEILNPQNRTSSESAFSVNRWGHSCSVLSGGEILIAGGFSGTLYPLRAASTAVLITPPRLRQELPMLSARAGHTAALLPNGMVVLAGGISEVNGHLVSYPAVDYEFFNPRR
jgi:hypothetical protein